MPGAWFPEKQLHMNGRSEESCWNSQKGACAEHNAIYLIRMGRDSTWLRISLTNQDKSISRWFISAIFIRRGFWPTRTANQEEAHVSVRSANSKWQEISLPHLEGFVLTFTSFQPRSRASALPQ
jgi:hypothetical protein